MHPGVLSKIGIITDPRRFAGESHCFNMLMKYSMYFHGTVKSSYMSMVFQGYSFKSEIKSSENKLSGVVPYSYNPTTQRLARSEIP